MKLDARIAVALPQHPKMKRLIYRLGVEAAWRLVCLWLWARQNRSDGNLEGLSDEDLELAVDWPASNGKLIEALATIGFLEGPEKKRRLHDWEDHQPWSAGENDRSKSSKWSALVRHHGFEAAKAMMPDYYESHAEQCERYAKRTPKHANACDASANASKNDAPSPSPSPSPSPIPTPTLSLSADADEPKLTLQTLTDPPQPPPAGSDTKKKKGARQRNAELDALAVVGGGSVESVTAPMWGETAKALKDIREVCPEVTAAMIQQAAQAYREKWKNATLSPSALAKHWQTFGPQKKEGGGERLEPDWDWPAVFERLYGAPPSLPWKGLLERMRDEVSAAYARDGKEAA